MRGRRGVLLGAAALPWLGRAASAQGGGADRVVRLVVPFPPGGGADTLARTVAPAASAVLGQTLVVDNRPGAGGNVGAEHVARSTPDGTTLLYGTNGTHAINPALYPRLGFDPAADFAPVAALTRIALVLVVTPDLPVRTLPELIAHLKAHPGRVTFASAGNGTTSHIAGEMFRMAAGVEIVHVPYRGNAAAMTDLIAGRVGMAIDLMPVAYPQVQGGRLRALAVAASAPVPAAPDLPTIASVLPGFEASAWDGAFAPAGTPAAEVRRLNAAFRGALAQGEVVERLRARGAEPSPVAAPEEFAAFVAAEQPKWATAVRASGARID